MFLKLLNDEEKELFLSLAVKAAEANGSVEEEEMILIEDYCREMDIAKKSYKDYENKLSIEEIKAGLNKSEISHKRLILFELIGIMHADNTYDDVEKDFIADFAGSIGIEGKELEAITEYVSAYIANVKMISEFFMNGPD